MSKKVIFSGIQPSGNLHIGNYISVIKQWVELQNDPESELIFCIVDLHAITVPYDVKELRSKSRQLAALYIACGIDPDKSTIFIQSSNPDHTELAWILNCLTPMGWMERMTQYKDKGKAQSERTSVGLFSYPVLMAADILLYDADLVPVGHDQTQHVEYARDIAKRFNSKRGDVFKIPDVMVSKGAARIMSLQDPAKKMSKSDESQTGTIRLQDNAETIEKKIMRAVTDSGDEIRSGEDKPAMTNLLTIYSQFSGKSVEGVESEFSGAGYGDFKKKLAEIVVGELEPIWKKQNELSQDKEYLDRVLGAGLEKSRSVSSEKIKAVKKATGLSL